jgi:hypothetical protein
MMTGRGKKTGRRCAVTAAAALLYWTPCISSDSSSTAFFNELHRSYLQDYRECTGDTTAVAMKKLVAWKTRINAFESSKLYPKILKQYCETSSIAPAHAAPCQVLNWYEREQGDRDEIESILESSHTGKEGEDLKRGRIEKELERCTPSVFDFPRIPFGVSRPAFALIVEETHGLTPYVTADFMFLKEFSWEDRKFLTAFFFNDDSLLYKYEIESATYGGKELNGEVRPLAKHLAAVFEHAAGSPTSSYRIGYYDLRSGRLTPYCRWDTPGHTAAVGICVSDDRRYYAKAVIVDKNLAPSAAKPRK